MTAVHKIIRNTSRKLLDIPSSPMIITFAGITQHQTPRHPVEHKKLNLIGLDVHQARVPFRKQLLIICSDGRLQNERLVMKATCFINRSNPKIKKRKNWLSKQVKTGPTCETYFHLISEWLKPVFVSSDRVRSTSASAHNKVPFKPSLTYSKSPEKDSFTIRAPRRVVFAFRFVPLHSQPHAA